MDFIQLLALFSIIIPLAAAIWFIITLIIYNKTDVSSAKKRKRGILATVFGLIAGVLVFLPFILIVAVAVISQLSGLPLFWGIPIVLTVVFIVLLIRYIKTAGSDKRKRIRGVAAAILGSVTWVMVFTIDILFALLFLGVISAM